MKDDALIKRQKSFILMETMIFGQRCHSPAKQIEKRRILSFSARYKKKEVLK